MTLKEDNTKGQQTGIKEEYQQKNKDLKFNYNKMKYIITDNGDVIMGDAFHLEWLGDYFYNQKTQTEDLEKFIKKTKSLWGRAVELPNN